MDLRLDKIPMPDRLPALMKDFCKSAIKVQPTDLLHWSHLYFKHCADSSFPIAVNTQWQLPIVLESHLSPQLIQMLARTLANENGYILVEDLRRYWTGHRMDAGHLQDLLYIVSQRPYRYIHRRLFVALASAHVSPNLRATLYNVCSILHEDRMVPLEEWLRIYKYLALLDMGGRCESELSYQDDASDGLSRVDTYVFSPLDYVHVPYICSTGSPSSSDIFTSSCPSESKVMVWKELILEDPDRSDLRRVKSQSLTSRDGLVMWTERAECEDYIGVLELVKKQMDPIGECLQARIEHLLSNEIDSDGQLENRRLNVEKKKCAFQRKRQEDILDSNIDAYKRTIKDKTDEVLERTRLHHLRLKEIDRKLISLKEMLLDKIDWRALDYRSDNWKGWEMIHMNEVLERIAKYVEERDVHSGNQEEKTKEADVPSEEQQKLQREFRRYLKPYIVDNVRNILNLVDCILDIPLGQVCTQPLQDAQEALNQVVNFVLDSTHETPCAEEQAPTERSRECMVKREVVSKMRSSSSGCIIQIESAGKDTLGLNFDGYDLTPRLAIASGGGRYCVAGIGRRVSAATIEVAVRYFASVSSDQCGMVRVRNVIDILCPPLQ